jgi:hypothetical protein
MTRPDPSAPLTDAERAWLDARAAAFGVGPAAYAGPLSAGADGRIVLSTDAKASAVAPVDGGGTPVFIAESAHLRAGETLVITSPRRQAVQVVLGRLSTEGGGRMEVDTPLELSAATGDFGSGIVEEFIGRTGAEGAPGNPGSPSGDMRGGEGGPGSRGDDGPGGAVWYRELRGNLTVVAGGGNGGQGGPGGNGAPGGHYSSGGGPGGPGGNGGEGGSVVIAFTHMAEDANIRTVARVAEGGRGGRGGDPGPGSEPGRPGYGGPEGREGTEPSFSIRFRPDA